MSSRKTKSRPSNVIEQLESRVLLTTLAGGGPGRTNASFEYFDASGNYMRIALRGNIVAEFLGYDVARRRIVDLLTTPPQSNIGIDLFSIYVAQADLGSSISIAQVPPPGQGGTGRPMEPFSGEPPTMNVTNAINGMMLTPQPASNSGAGYLGARTMTADPMTSNIPIIWVKLNGAFGVRPADPSGKVVAGLFTAPGVSLGQFLFGGVVTGKVDIEGSCNLFYAGEVWTGEAGGLANGESPTFKQNFYVGGDLRNLVSIGSPGTDTLMGTLDQPDYKTGFDMRVIGRVGQVMSKDSFLGAVTVFNSKTVQGAGTAIQEIETRDIPFPVNSDDSFFEGEHAFGSTEQLRAPSLGDNAIFDNDTIDTAQYLGTFASIDNGGNLVVEVAGTLNDNVMVQDDVDYYALPLLAGQTIQVQLTTGDPSEHMNVAVFDPDSKLVSQSAGPTRMIASDYSNTNEASVQGLPFRFTADRPGVYRFAVAWSGDINFNGDQDPGESKDSFSGPTPYVLLLTGASDLGLGAIVATNSIGNTDHFDPSTFNFVPTTSIDVEQGDLGALMSTDTSTDDSVNSIFSSGAPITVKHGNLRVIDAGSIGILVGVVPVQEPTEAPDLLVPRGAVGLLRASDTAASSGMLSVNLNMAESFSGTFSPSNAIGFDYQEVDAGAMFAGNLLADRGIGILRADRIGSDGVPTVLAVNADNRGNDGFIDLIDATSQLGTLSAGGPEITTGNSGNVRYIHVGNVNNVFRDRLFGGGTDEVTHLAPGQTFRYTDDSGATVKITPTPGPVFGQTSTNLTGIGVLTYPIRGKGGSVLVDVSTYTINTDVNGIELAAGLTVDIGNTTGMGTAEIGSIHMDETGSPVTFTTTGTDAAGNPISTQDFTTDSSAFQPVTITLKGRLPVDVYDIVGTNLNTVDNRTTGQIVNLEAQSVGTITGQDIGIAYSKTKGVLQGATIFSDDFPFSQQRNLIGVTGDIQSIQARGAVGNVEVGGTIGTVAANTDNLKTESIIEGIDAPIVAGGNLINVNIGQQLTDSGSGNFEHGGLFAVNAIVNVTNQGTGSDIRGDIVAEDSDGGLFAGSGNPTVLGIGNINLTNGAIIDSDVLVVTDFHFALEFPQVFQITGGDGSFPATIHAVGGITIKGIGGIIGTWVAGNNLGAVSIKGGFGIVDTLFQYSASGDFSGISADGYGIRHSTLEGGATIDHVIATGNGKLLNTLAYTPSVRQSETGAFDAFTGQSLTEANDLHVYLGTTRAKPTSTDKSEAGTIEDTTIEGSRDLNLISAFRIFGRPSVLDPLTGSPAMRISIGENIGDMITTQDIDGLALTAGVVSLLQSGRNLLNDSFNVGNSIGSVLIRGNLKASASIQVLSGEGTIDTISTGLALYGNVLVATRIGKLLVGTDLGATSVSSSRDITFAHINGSIRSGGTLRAANTINQLIIGHNIDLGGTVRAKRILSKTILGQVVGEIITG